VAHFPFRWPVAASYFTEAARLKFLSY
jgi:hypothetical protein